MTKRMLIDATHDEETRVVVIDGNRLTEFDYESKLRKQIKGNIFLAKVTRVEPSLQAAFVNFGGNRHGFLPFSEIHPDYYRIPVADREALIAEQQALEAAEPEEDEDEDLNTEGDSDTHTEDGIEEIGGLHPDSHLGESHEEGEESENEEGDDSENARTRNESEENGDSRADKTRNMNQDLPDADLLEEAETDIGDLQDQSADEDGDTEDGIDSDEGEDRGEEEDETEDEDSNSAEMDENSENGGQPSGDQNRARSWRPRKGRRYMGSRSRRDEVSEDGPSSLHARFRRKYKIQEVIKRGQIMLIQVSKEERGNKGAAVTTYLSLPGRYCVLMPNSPRGGGVSRKIASSQDRSRLKEMLRDLEVPSGMSVILRTAGVSRTKIEIKRDLDYLTRLWDNIRDLTLKSTAPAAIYEEGDLIKRSIRDIYTRDIDDIFVAGEAGYHEAKDFMKMLMPSHARRVQLYKDDKIPLFHRYQIESQINEMGEPTVQLKSGGYLVINPTEALVAIDVNSGRATKERHIEETALKTNMEAAEEVARQLRLRDLGGLIVIDFIDMEDRRNNAKVERKLKEALATDRARIQIGRISSFGLMEMSRQRLNPSLTESQFLRCPHCQGFGFVRTIDSAAIMALRALEDEGIRDRSTQVLLHVPNDIALYILNQKRALLVDIERRYGFTVLIRVDESLTPGHYLVEPLKTPAPETEDDETGSAEEIGESEAAPQRQDRPDRGDRNNRRDRSGQGRPERNDRNRDRSIRPDSVAGGDETGEVDSSPRDEMQQAPRPPRRDHPQGGNNGERGDGEGRSRRRRGGRSRHGGPDRFNEDRGARSDQPPVTGEGADTLIESAPDAPSYKITAAEQTSASPTQAKPKTTYFVAKRRSTPEQTTEQDTGAPAPAAPPQVAAPEKGDSPAESPKKGWWNRFS